MNSLGCKPVDLIGRNGGVLVFFALRSKKMTKHAEMCYIRMLLITKTCNINLKINRAIVSGRENDKVFNIKDENA